MGIAPTSSYSPQVSASCACDHECIPVSDPPDADHELQTQSLPVAGRRVSVHPQLVTHTSGVPQPPLGDPCSVYAHHATGHEPKSVPCDVRGGGPTTPTRGTVPRPVGCELPVPTPSPPQSPAPRTRSRQRGRRGIVRVVQLGEAVLLMTSRQVATVREALPILQLIRTLRSEDPKLQSTAAMPELIPVIEDETQLPLQITVPLQQLELELLERDWSSLGLRGHPPESGDGRSRTSVPWIPIHQGGAAQSEADESDSVTPASRLRLRRPSKGTLLALVAAGVVIPLGVAVVLAVLTSLGVDSWLQLP